MSKLGKVLMLAIPIGIAVMATGKKRASGGGSGGGGGGGTGPTGPASWEPGTGPPASPAVPAPPSGGQLPDWPAPSPETPPQGSWLASLGEMYSVEREAQILDAVAGGLADPIGWYSVLSYGAGAYDGYTMHIPVMADALMVEGVRVNGTYPTAQAIADRNGWLLFTPFVAGLVFAQADAQLFPTTSQELTIKHATAQTSQMIEASRRVDAKLRPIKESRDAAGLATLVGNPGKDWVLTRIYADGGKHPQSGVPHIDAGANHGLFTSDWKPIQNVGVFHALFRHVDYSQTLRFMGGKVQLEHPDGQRENLDARDVLMDPELAHMLTGVKNEIYGSQVGEGALPYWRHPRLALSNS